MQSSFLEGLALSMDFAAASSGWDGVFWLQPLEASVYCRPSCNYWTASRGHRTRILEEKPRENENLRPCPYCKPEKVKLDDVPNGLTALHLLWLIRQNLPQLRSKSFISKMLKVPTAKLNDLCLVNFHLPFEMLVERERAKKAGQLLQMETQPINEVPNLLGLKNINEVSELISKHWGLSLETYRDLANRDVYEIDLPQTFRKDLIRPYWIRDSEDLTIQAHGEGFLRTFRLSGKGCLVEMNFEGLALKIRRPPDLTREETYELHRQIVRTLGFSSMPNEFQASMDRLGLNRLYSGREGLRVVLTATTFEALIWSIIGQQINLSFAFRLRNRLIRLAGQELGEKLFAHPTPREAATIAPELLLNQQFSKRKVEYLLEIAGRIESGVLPIESLENLPFPIMMKMLLAERGIGLWTARYVAMRGCGFGNCAPVGDAGLRKALVQFFNLKTSPDTHDEANLMGHFSPYQSLATFHLWGMLS